MNREVPVRFCEGLRLKRLGLLTTRHQKSFVIAAFVAILFSGTASVAAEGAHNLILIIPEALPANGVDQSNAPALARLRREGVTFTNSHSGFHV